MIRIKERYMHQTFICLIYSLSFLYFVFKLFYYASEFVGFPDEPAHISYIIELSLHKCIIPDFKTLIMYSYNHWATSTTGFVVPFLPLNGTVNYLGHPPLYYQLMALTNSVHLADDGQVLVNVFQLRTFSIAIASVGIMIAYWIGFSRLWKNGILINAIYAVSIASLPLLSYDCAGVNNDCLVFMGIICYFMGVLRFTEGIKDQKTYLIIGLSFLICGLTKLTALLLIAICSLVIFVLDVIETRSFSIICNKFFARTLVFYIIVTVYYLFIKQKYKVFQPTLSNLNYNYFITTGFYVPVENRVIMSPFKYVRHFWNSFWISWSSIIGHNTIINSSARYPAYSFYGLLYTVPIIISACVALVQIIKRQRKNVALPFVVAFSLTLFAQYINARGVFVQNGYLGNTQARYYLALNVPFSFIMSKAISEAKKRQYGVIFKVIGVLLILAWLSGDFIHIMTHLSTFNFQ